MAGAACLSAQMPAPLRFHPSVGKAPGPCGVVQCAQSLGQHTACPVAGADSLWRVSAEAAAGVPLAELELKRMSWVTSRLRLGRCRATRLYGNSAMSLCKVDKPSATQSTPFRLVTRGVYCTSAKTLWIVSSISTQTCMLSQTAAVGVGRAWLGVSGWG